MNKKTQANNWVVDEVEMNDSVDENWHTQVNNCNTDDDTQYRKTLCF